MTESSKNTIKETIIEALPNFFGLFITISACNLIACLPQFNSQQSLYIMLGGFVLSIAIIIVGNNLVWKRRERKNSSAKNNHNSL